MSGSGGSGELPGAEAQGTRAPGRARVPLWRARCLAPARVRGGRESRLWATFGRARVRASRFRRPSFRLDFLLELPSHALPRID